MAHVEAYPVVSSDFSVLEGTGCYCSDEAAETIRGEVTAMPLRAIHLLGSGDCHYVSLFWLERIAGPFALILIDNHPDDQMTAFGPDILSCGSWALNARKLPGCREVIWLQEFHESPRLPDCPIYLSIDMDVLSEQFARTNWNQGSMTLDELLETVKRIMSTGYVIGVDICGSSGKGSEDLSGDEVINKRTIKEICAAINGSFIELTTL